MRLRRWHRVGMLAAVLLAAALVFAGLTYRSELRREVERVSSGSQVLDTRCGPIEFAATGAGRAVLLVHGAGGGFDQTLGIAQEIAAQGFHVIAVSRFGYLRTPLPADASPAKQADAHACLLDALGIERAAIVGISAGAPSTLQFALRHPQRAEAMVLLVPLAYAPSAEPAPEMTRATRFMLETVVRSDFLYWSALKVAQPMVVKTILATPPERFAAASAREQARARELMQHLLPLSARGPGLLNDWRIGSSITRYPLERIGTRALVISLEDDLYGTFRSALYSAAHISDARFVGYRSGGHVWLGHHDEILSEIATFLGAHPMASDWSSR